MKTGVFKHHLDLPHSQTLPLSSLTVSSPLLGSLYLFRFVSTSNLDDRRRGGCCWVLRFGGQVGAPSNSFSPNSFLRSDLHVYPDFLTNNLFDPSIINTTTSTTPKIFSPIQICFSFGFCFCLGFVGMDM